MPLLDSKNRSIASNPKFNICLNASAGTGKTKILVDRFLRMLLRGIKPDSIMCITFTNVAAHEMVERISAQLEKWFLADEKTLQNEIFKLTGQNTYQDLNKVRALYKNYINAFEKLKICTIHSLCFDIINQNSKITLIEEHKKIAILEVALARTIISSKKHCGALDAICQHYNYNRLMDIAQKFLQHQAQLIQRPIETFVKSQINLAEFKINTNIAQENTIEFEEYKGLFLTKLGQKRKRLPKIEGVTQDQLLAEQQRVFEYEIKKHNQQYVHHHNALVEFLIITWSCYIELLKKNHLIDHNGIILKARDILSCEDQRVEIMKKFYSSVSHVMIDETQDTSKSQWEIINLIYQGLDQQSTIFMVGDIKQSIYGFGGSDPSLFKENARIYANHLERNRMKILDINVSFRSKSEVLHAVDRIFNNPSIKRYMNTEKIQHNSYRGPGGKVVLHDLTTDDCNDIKQKHAKYIAKIVSDILAQKKYYPSDIMILLRKRTNLAKGIIQEIQNLNISVSDPDRLYLRDNLIFLDLLAILKFIHDPKDDMNLSCLLKSPIFKFSDMQLAQITNNRDKACIIDILKIKEKATYNALQNIYKQYQDCSIYSFYHQIIRKNREDFIKAFGNEASLILDKFIQLIHSYCLSSIKSTKYAIQYLENEANDIKNEICANGVQVMTVHGAKGLQAPVVILADATPQNNAHDSFDILWDKENNLFLKTIGANDSQIFLSAKEDVDLKTKTENLRLLYVAMTRASDCLHITGYQSKKKNTKQGDWYDIIKNNQENLLRT